MHGATQREVGLHVELQIVDDRPLASPTVLARLGVEDELVQQREPVAWGRLRIRTVRPKFRNHPGVVAAGHDVGLVRLARERVELVSLASEVAVLVVPRHQAAFFPRVELVEVCVGGQAAVVLQARGADVPHHAVVGAQVLAPAHDHAVVPLPQVLKPTGHSRVDVHRRAWVVPNIVLASIILQHRQVAVAEGKTWHLAPLWPEERRGLGQEFSALVDRKTQLDRLPSVGVLKAVGPWNLRQDVGLALHVAGRGVVVRFVGAVGEAVGDELLCDVVAQRRRAMGGVIGAGEARIELLDDHLDQDVVHGGLRLGTVRIPVAQQPEHRVADGHLLGLLNAFRRARNLQRLGVKRARVAVEGLAEEHVLRGGRIVRRPAVVHQDARVVQVPRVHRGPRKVVADGFEVLLVPLVRHCVLLRRDACAPHHHEPHRPHRTLHPILVQVHVVQSQVQCNVRRVGRRVVHPRMASVDMPMWPNEKPDALGAPGLK